LEGKQLVGLLLILVARNVSYADRPLQTNLLGLELYFDSALSAIVILLTDLC